MKNLFYLFTLCIALTACSSDDDGNVTPPQPAARTVIAFISGDNNLADSLNSDYNEMIAGSAKLSSDVNLIVVNDLKNKLPFIAKVSDGTATTVRKWDDDFYVTTPDSMLSIMQWIVNTYPAKEYATIFTGHGNGSRQMRDTVQTDIHRIYAYGIDYNTSSNDGIWINIPSLAAVLSNLKTPEGLPIYQEFIFFDCCNMQTVENAYELRNYTKYISAPVSEVAAEGANYNEVVPLLSYNFDNDPSQLLFYNDKIKLCASVIDTDALERLLDATRNVLYEIKSNDSDSNTTSLRYQGAIYYSHIHNPFLHDIQNVFLNHVENGTLSKSTFQTWKNCLAQTIITKKMATKWPTSLGIDFNAFTVSDETYGGLSMITPRYGYDYSVAYQGSKELLANDYMFDYEWCNKVGWHDLGW